MTVYCLLRAELSSTATTHDSILVTSCQVMEGHGYCSNFVLLRLCRALQHSFRALPRSRVVGLRLAHLIAWPVASLSLPCF